MAELHPVDFRTLVDRLDRELAAGGPVYGLARRDWWRPRPGVDLSLEHLGRRLATPFGPAAGPHTQLAQNLVPAYLAGARFFELKTVQVRDELDIPRPCIEAPDTGYNVEWSQELRLEESAREYAKAWALLHRVAAALGDDPAAFALDVSVGYDLAGIRSERVAAFLDAMRDASGLLAELWADLPPGVGPWAVPARISDSITLSTFHGCPADEVEAIAAHLLDAGWHVVVKLNPTLLGHDRVRALLDGLGYGDVGLDPDDFARDLGWHALVDMVPRLRARAEERGLVFGVKLTNTLVTRSGPSRLFSVAGEVYLSGPPLRAIALEIAARLRAEFPDLPLTFSAGVDRASAADVVGAGIGPVTGCTDLLKGRGYGRLAGWVRGLEEAMEIAGAADLAAFRAAFAEERGGLEALAERTAADPSISRGAAKPPRTVERRLELLDCIACDRCIPVCPNLAIFAFPVPEAEAVPGRLRWYGAGVDLEPAEGAVVRARHQIGIVADLCNRCGQCAVWCPEQGAPYRAKPAFFRTRGSFEAEAGRDGLLVEGAVVEWRRAGRVLRLVDLGDGRERVEVEGGAVTLRDGVPGDVAGEGEVELADLDVLRWLRDSVRAAEAWMPAR